MAKLSLVRQASEMERERDLTNKMHTMDRSGMLQVARASQRGAQLKQIEALKHFPSVNEAELLPTLQALWHVLASVGCGMLWLIDPYQWSKLLSAQVEAEALLPSVVIQRQDKSGWCICKTHDARQSASNILRQASCKVYFWRCQCDGSNLGNWDPEIAVTV